MVEFVGKNDVALARERGDHADIGHVARRIGHCRLAPEKGREPLFKFDVERLRPGCKARAASSCAESLRRIGGGLLDTRILREAEVVV